MGGDLPGPLIAQRALQIASAAHAGQRDATGAPYFGHVNRVTAYAEMFRIQAAPTLDRFDVAATAILHDVLEDSTVTGSMLAEQGIPERVVVAVSALTHTPHEPRATYLDRVRRDPLALVVKWADTWDNADPHRLARVTDPERRARLAAKYANAFRVLEGPALTGAAPRWR